MSDLISRNALLDAMPKNDELLSVDVRRIICEAPKFDAVPFKVIAGVCKHRHVACVDSDNRVYDHVCRKTNPNSFETCSPETCPLIEAKEDAPCE
jgi:hypothetical protein